MAAFTLGLEPATEDTEITEEGHEGGLALSRPSNIKVLYADRPPERFTSLLVRKLRVSPPWLTFRLASFPEPRPNMLPPLVGSRSPNLSGTKSGSEGGSRPRMPICWQMRIQRTSHRKPPQCAVMRSRVADDSAPTACISWKTNSIRSSVLARRCSLELSANREARRNVSEPLQGSDSRSLLRFRVRALRSPALRIPTSKGIEPPS